MHAACDQTLRPVVCSTSSIVSVRPTRLSCCSPLTTGGGWESTACGASTRFLRTRCSALRLRLLLLFYRQALFALFDFIALVTLVSSPVIVFQSHFTLIGASLERYCTPGVVHCVLHPIHSLDLLTASTVLNTQVRVPMLVRVPWLTSGHGRSTSALVEHVDIMPTLLDLAGILPRVLESDALDGTSFLSVLKDPSTPHKPAAFSQYVKPPFPCIRPTSLHARLRKYSDFD
jgi:hypothetical protein